MNSWYKSFVLHPLFNRFNMIYMVTWFFAGVATELPHVFISGLAVEGIYLAVRYALDKTGINIFQLRKLPSAQKKRFLDVAEKAARIQDDVNLASPNSPLMNHSAGQAKRLTHVFLQLLLMEYRLSTYIRSINENYDDKIRELTGRLSVSQGEVKNLLQKNLEIYLKRREKYFAMVEKEKVIAGRLDTIENTLKLLGDTTVGLGSPNNVSDQLDLLLTNVQDAETFMTEMDEYVPDVITRQRVR